ncbi:MAG: GMC family oxidoreductase N-terminal domain-containing protein [Alphaproteobacteria bacterium]
MTQGRTAYDFVVVGAGTAGCVLAARLSEDRHARVALVEAGRAASDPAIADPLAWPALQGSAVDWGYATVPQAAGRRHAWPRGRVLGGSSAINAMAHVRGHPDDFDRWAAAGCRGWGYADLMPYFRRSEDSPLAPSPYHAAGGPIRLMRPEAPHPITEAYRAAGAERGLAPTADHNGSQMAGPTLNTLTIDRGRRQTVADAYLTEAVRARPNLALLTGLLVDRLALEPDGRCTGIAVVDQSGTRTIRADRAVVLAAGAIGSPAILLRSGIGPADELAALGIRPLVPLAGVGANLHDHLLSGGNVYRARRPVPPSRYQHSESLMYIAGEGADPAPQLVLACVIAPVTTEAFTAPEAGSAYTVMFGFTHPRSRGTLRLASADPLAQPLLDPAYLSDPADRARYAEALDWARAVGGAQALDDWRADELLPTPADLADEAARQTFLARAAYTHHHPVGTCRMGTGADAVVGPDLAVRGCEGLYVADAAVMPSITTGPVNAAILAIAERASDLIAGRDPLPPYDPRTVVQP